MINGQIHRINRQTVSQGTQGGGKWDSANSLSSQTSRQRKRLRREEAPCLGSSGDPHKPPDPFGLELEQPSK